ncbi:MAG: hypothetical protein A2622_10760 [Bdellovibrionales bacterium RIFCSPHIGHO2_01_FULL_40_29]|nr:MAG: hypothetical protein A2622_10760 [Bdellovibrionales bacterium RIFCSPHIGHO2_01_FULL_40_29]OFZ34437.1 MAG: hypothetical protein A3D17_01025 [Bdellovibrionales bacterium RIFCSPHIGHO2_02_FULL_40_15]
MRKILTSEKTHQIAKEAMASFHNEIVQEVEKATHTYEWVVVGMKQNPVVTSAKKFLNEKQIPFHYIEYGSYFSKWKQRLAIKLWSGWPTFPQIFHKGVLIGGYSDLKKYLK